MPPVSNYFKLLTDGFIKKKDTDEEMKSEEGSTVCEEIMMKSEYNYERFEDAFYSRLIMILSSLS